MPLTEEELILLFRKNDPEAFRRLYERYAGKMMAVCVRYMGDPDEAKDVLQDGFMKVNKYIGDFRGEGSLEGWVRRIMVNTALLALRKNKLRFQSDDHAEFELHTSFDEALDTLSVQEILKLIAKLPTGYRTVFNLYVMEGYTHKSIADELSINESTSRSQLTKARVMLQDMILNQRKVASKSLPVL